MEKKKEGEGCAREKLVFRGKRRRGGCLFPDLRVRPTKKKKGERFDEGKRASKRGGRLSRCWVRGKGGEPAGGGKGASSLPSRRTGGKRGDALRGRGAAYYLKSCTRGKKASPQRGGKRGQACIRSSGGPASMREGGEEVGAVSLTGKEAIIEAKKRDLFGRGKKRGVMLEEGGGRHIFLPLPGERGKGETQIRKGVIYFHPFSSFKEREKEKRKEGNLLHPFLARKEIFFLEEEKVPPRFSVRRPEGGTRKKKKEKRLPLPPQRARGGGEKRPLKEKRREIPHALLDAARGGGKRERAARGEGGRFLMYPPALRERKKGGVRVGGGVNLSLLPAEKKGGDGSTAPEKKKKREEGEAFLPPWETGKEKKGGR